MSTPCARPHHRIATAIAVAVLAFTATGCSSGSDPADPTAPVSESTAPPAEASAPAPVEIAANPTSPAAAMATARALRSLPRFVRMFGRQGTEDGALQLPFCLAMDDAGVIYIGDTVGLQAFDHDGTFIRRFGAGTLAGVNGVAVSPDGNTVYAADQTGLVVAMNADGTVARTLSSADGGAISAPNAMELAADGDLYVADTDAGQVVVFGPNGAVRRTIGEPGQGSGQFTSPRALAFDLSGMLYVGLGDDYLIQRFDAAGAYIDSVGHTYADETIFRVGDMAFDDDGRLYATRSATHYVGVYDVTAGHEGWIGDFGKVGGGPGEFNTPTGIAIFDGQLYIADQDNHRVQVFDLPPPVDRGE